ncbi:MAG: hypothetical protein FWG14_04110 [Peptococcaceae bacterium]|nr:hypothetical protein [Peptococcaceae bacterium]
MIEGVDECPFLTVDLMGEVMILSWRWQNLEIKGGMLAGVSCEENVFM